MENLPPLSSPFERLLVQLDANPTGALLRSAVGFAFLPLWQHFAGPGAAGWWIFLLFVALLFTIRILPLLLRKVVRFPPGSEAVWRYRRTLAKRFDSYQWRKLLLFGTGMFAYGVAVQNLDPWEIALVVANIAAGAVGEWAWRASNSSGRQVGKESGQVIQTDDPAKSSKSK